MPKLTLKSTTLPPVLYELAIDDLERELARDVIRALVPLLPGSPLEQHVRLVFRGHILRPDNALSEDGVIDGSIITFTLASAPTSPAPSAAAAAAAAAAAGAGAALPPMRAGTQEDALEAELRRGIDVMDLALRFPQLLEAPEDALHPQLRAMFAEAPTLRRFLLDRDAVRLQRAMRSLRPDSGGAKPPRSQRRLFAKLQAHFLARPAVIAHLLETQREVVTSEILDCLGNPAAIFARMYDDDALLSPLPALLPGESAASSAPEPPSPLRRLVHLPSREFTVRRDAPRSLDALLDRLLEMSSQERASGASSRALRPADVMLLRALAEVLARPAAAFTSPAPQGALDVLLRCLAWAPQRAWAALDLLRVALTHVDAAARIARAPGESLVSLLSEFCAPPAADASGEGGGGGGGGGAPPAAAAAPGASPPPPAATKTAILAARAMANMVINAPTRIDFMEGAPIGSDAAAALLRHPSPIVALEGAHLLFNVVHCGVQELRAAGLGRGMPVFIDPFAALEGAPPPAAAREGGAGAAAALAEVPLLQPASGALAKLVRALGAALEVPACALPALLALGSLVCFDCAAVTATAGIAALREGLKGRVAAVEGRAGAAEDVKEVAREVLLLLEHVERRHPEYAALMG